MTRVRTTASVDPVIVSCAVRYALGRSTYMPGLVADEVRRNWRSLGEQQSVIRGDVAEWLRSIDDHSAAGRAVWHARVDIEVWRNLLAWMDDTEPALSGSREARDA